MDEGTAVELTVSVLVDAWVIMPILELYEAVGNTLRWRPCSDTFTLDMGGCLCRPVNVRA